MRRVSVGAWGGEKGGGLSRGAKEEKESTGGPRRLLLWDALARLFRIFFKGVQATLREKFGARSAAAAAAAAPPPPRRLVGLDALSVGISMPSASGSFRTDS